MGEPHEVAREARTGSEGGLACGSSASAAGTDDDFRSGMCGSGWCGEEEDAFRMGSDDGRGVVEVEVAVRRVRCVVRRLCAFGSCERWCSCVDLALGPCRARREAREKGHMVGLMG